MTSPDPLDRPPALWESLRRLPRSLRLYALLLLLPLGWFAWGAFTGSRLLGDDLEGTEELDGPAGHHGPGSHSRFYHK